MYVDFQYVAESIPISAVLDLIGWSCTKKRGDQLRGGCPVHRSTNPKSDCFSVNVRTGRYQCFKCGSKGDVIDLYAGVQRHSLRAAAVELSRLYGINSPQNRTVVKVAGKGVGDG